MKKAISILLAVLVLLSVTATTMAAGNTTEISLDLDPSSETYTLNIPAKVEIDPASMQGEIEVTLSDPNLLWNTFLTVYANSQNHIDGEDNSYLVDTEDQDAKIAYSVNSESTGDTSFEATEQGLRAAVYNAAHEYRGTTYSETLADGIITLTVNGAIPGDGVYTDLLTFSVDLETISDRYDRSDRDVTEDEVRNLYLWIREEIGYNSSNDTLMNGSVKIINNASQVTLGEKYVLESDFHSYSGTMDATAMTIANWQEHYPDQSDLNYTYIGLVTARETLLSKIQVKN